MGLHEKIFGRVSIRGLSNLIPEEKILYLLKIKGNMAWWQIASYAGLGSQETKNLLSYLVKKGIIKNLGVAKELSKFNHLSDEDRFVYSITKSQ